jgi:cellobiose phosphorylase
MEMSEPTTVRAGDTWTWDVSESDYSDYTLTYYLRNATGKLDFEATADGYDYTVSVEAVTTAAVKPGVYSWIRRVVGELGSFTTGQGSITVLPNLALNISIDARTYARQALDNIEAYLIDPNNVAAASYSIGGRSLSRWSRTELLVERDKWLGEVRSEEAATRVSQGLGNPRRLYVRFDR